MSNRYKILVIEDEANITRFVSALLEANGYQAICAKNGSTGLMCFSSHKPDVVILDLGLPDIDGTEVLKAIREQSLTPIIVLSARDRESDKVEALDLGANDYVTKPFGSAELVARIRSVLRTSRHNSVSDLASSGKFTSGELTLDYDARRLTLGGSEIKLTQTEYNIIAFLAQHVGKVMTYSTIIKEIWGYSDSGSIKKLQVNMANIRRKLGLMPGENKYISNELGVGYRMNNDF